MKKLILLLLFYGSLLSQTTDTLFILQTTDMHGNIYPYDYFTDQPDENRGLAKIYSRVIEYRKNHRNVILIDSGDLLQGTPLAYYFNHNDKELTHPLILTMNYMGYDAFTVGNHDIEQGLFVYKKAENESKFPWLSANASLEDKRTYYPPYTIIERNGLKIGILGLTTPGIPMWLDKNLYPGVSWEDMVSTARKYAAELRPKVDILVGSFHAGFNADYSQAQSDAAGLPNENASAWVAEKVNGFDAVFAGHSHRAGPMKPGIENKMSFNYGPLRLNAGHWGENLGVARIILSKDKSGWKVTDKQGWLESVRYIEPAQSILELTEYYHKKTLDYIRTQIGTLKTPISASNARFEDTALMDLINDAQLDFTGADISFVSSFNDKFKLDAGPIFIKDIYGMYRYENFLYVIQMTGRQIRDFLEYSARYFILENGRVKTNPEIAGYNYDMAEGVNYQIDLYEEPGRRIINMRDPKTGKPFDMNKTYTVALNSYRASGGGGHLAAAGALNNKIVFKSTEEMRNILADYISKKRTITATANKNWMLLK